jgi:hypothetical protein
MDFFVVVGLSVAATTTHGQEKSIQKIQPQTTSVIQPYMD